MPEYHPHCAVYLLDIYLSKFPPCAFQNEIFYLRPKAKTPALDTEPWYKNAPVGKNKLATLVKEMFLEAGFEENPKTNHSLRAMLFLRLVYRNRLYQKQQGTDHLRHCEAMRGHRWTKKKKNVVY